MKDAIDIFENAGFSGDNLFIAAHSLGGVMSQNFLQSSAAAFKGQILMGSVLRRDTRSIQEDGSTWFDFTTPTLTIGGTRDGLMRLTRVAESFYHQVENIAPAQSDLFPVVVLEGVSHSNFSSGKPPRFVQRNDLRSEIPETTAH